MLSIWLSPVQWLLDSSNSPRFYEFHSPECSGSPEFHLALVDHDELSDDHRMGHGEVRSGDGGGGGDGGDGVEDDDVDDENELREAHCLLCVHDGGDED